MVIVSATLQKYHGYPHVKFLSQCTLLWRLYTHSTHALSLKSIEEVNTALSVEVTWCHSAATLARLK